MSRALVQATWDDVPHLTTEQKKALWDSLPPNERDARAKGVPSLGSGKIYPVSEETILCDPIEIPRWWPKAYGFDADWNNTAAVWGAWDRDSDTVYIWSEHYQGQTVPAAHASAIVARGAWIIGAMDPSTNGKINPKDGSRLADEYRTLGLKLVDADNAVEAGIFAVYQRMSRGGLKIFNTCRNTIAEFRIYRRDERGKVVKERDHLMDALRYLIMTGMMNSTTDPDDRDDAGGSTTAMGRNSVTGY